MPSKQLPSIEGTRIHVLKHGINPRTGVREGIPAFYVYEMQ